MPAFAHDGSGFMETNTAVAGGSMGQDVAVTTSVGQSYAFSVWLRSRTSTPVSGTLSLWGMGGTLEQGHTDFTVGPQWTLVSAPLDVAQAGHTQLRAEVYMATTGTSLDLDGAELIKNGLASASFENGMGGWKPISLSSSVNHATYKDAAFAHDGSGFMETNTAVAGGSMGQDVAVTTKVGESYAFSVWLRSRTSAPVSGTLCLWGMGGTLENGVKGFTVGPQWTLVTAPLDVAQAGHTQLRAEVYIATTGTNLDVDGSQLVYTGLASSGFENGMGGWKPISLSSSVNYATYKDPAFAHDGSGFMETNTAVAGGSMGQDVAVTTSVGQSYAFSVWLRSRTSAPVSGTLSLWGMGGTLEQGHTDFTVGPQWTLVTAPLDVAQAGHTQLRAEVYMATTGTSLDLDGATFARGGAGTAPLAAPPPAPAPTPADTVGPTTHAKAARGRKGHAVSLRYMVADSQSVLAKAARVVVKNSRGATITSMSCGSQPTGLWKSVRWTPKVRGTFRFYVYAKDSAGNSQTRVGSAKVVVR